ncbi:MAG: glycosyltransferase [Alphaproteobacteria bacterium]|nr:glycosyltransferase [Alphaproteobacteria bacterium]
MTIAVVIPTLDAAATLPRTLTAIAAARSRGLVGAVIVSDGGSTDGTAAVAAAAGARWLAGPPGRGRQLAAGIAAAGAPWLLLLHADTAPAPGWEDAAARWIATPASAGRAAHFRFRLDDASAAARRLERAVAWRTRRLGLPYGDQGLLIAAAHLDRLGGVRPLPLMEDVDLVRRIGRRNLDALPADALTSAARYRRDGWVLRPARNLACLGLYFLGLPPAAIRRLYG